MITQFQTKIDKVVYRNNGKKLAIMSANCKDKTADFRARFTDERGQRQRRHRRRQLHADGLSASGAESDLAGKGGPRAALLFAAGGSPPILAGGE